VLAHACVFTAYTNHEASSMLYKGRSAALGGCHSTARGDRGLRGHPLQVRLAFDELSKRVACDHCAPCRALGLSCRHINCCQLPSGSGHGNLIPGSRIKRYMNRMRIYHMMGRCCVAPSSIPVQSTKVKASISKLILQSRVTGPHIHAAEQRETHKSPRASRGYGAFLICR
jgi:hypothetical protein